MKKLTFVLAGALIAQAGLAQMTIDPEAGINFGSQRSVIGNNDAISSDARLGFQGGVGITVPFYEGLYLKPGVYYQNLSSESKMSEINTVTNMDYLRIPVNLGYRHQLSDRAGSLFAEAGPYAGYALSGNTKVRKPNESDIKTDISFGDDVNEVNRFDWGFDFGIGYETPWGVYVKGSYGLGLGNLSNVKDVTTTNRNWIVGVGYRVKL